MENIDRRVVKTRKRIQLTFAALIEEKSLYKVTIKDLTERADINRGTFYLHFQDKYDLLEKSEEEILQGRQKIAKDLDSVVINKWDKGQSPHPAAEKYFVFLKENGALVKALLGSKGDPSFQNKIKQLISSQIKGKFADVQPETIPIPSEYLIAYLVAAHLGVVQHWMENGFKDTPAEMAAIIANMNYFGPLAAGGLKFPSQ